MKIVTLNSWVNLFFHNVATNYSPLYSSALYSGFFNLQQWFIVPKTKELKNIFLNVNIIHITKNLKSKNFPKEQFQ